MDILQSLVNSLPGVAGQGLIWGLMAMGVYITYRILDVADLTVDGTLGTGGAVCVLLMVNGVNAWLALLIATIAGMLAGLVTGLFHTKCGIPAILSGILTQLALYSINLRIMGMAANKAVSVDKFSLVLSSRSISSGVCPLSSMAVTGRIFPIFSSSLSSTLSSTKGITCTINPPAQRTVLSPSIRTPSPTEEGICSDVAK